MRHRRPTNRPTRRKITLSDIPSEIASRLQYVKLTPDEERAFLQKLVEFEAAFRQTGDPLPLWLALSKVERSGQTVPHWLTKAFFGAIMRNATDDELKHIRQRGLVVRRYECVRDLRETVNKHTGKKHTLSEALDRAV